MSARAVLVAVGVFTALQSPYSVRADISFPFSITSSGFVDFSIQCIGPWLRLSNCASIGRDGADHREFYRVENSIFDPIGRWDCSVYAYSDCTRIMFMAAVTFCGPGVRGYPTSVDLDFDGEKLRVNQLATCASAKATSVLGQNGEDDASPAQDVDTYRFEGKPGQKVEIRLGRDGSGGSAGEVATLRVRAADGAPLAQRTGAVPLSLDVTLLGAVEIAVSRQPGHGYPLRGFYELEVIPQSGDIGERTLRPTANVEH